MANLLSTTIAGAVTETKGTISVSGTTITIDLSTGTAFELDISSATGDISTITINNVPAAAVSSFIVLIKQGTTNVRNIKWNALTNFIWPIVRHPVYALPATDPESNPSLSKVLKRDNILKFSTYDNGDTWNVENLGEFAGRVTNLYYGSRGVFGGGKDTSNQGRNDISYINISTPGDAVNFGDLTVARQYPTAASNGSRGFFAGGLPGGGGSGLNVIDYITIGTTGDALDFGDLSGQFSGPAAVSNGTRGLIGGGAYAAGGGSGWTAHVIDYITIASTGSSTNFGDLTQARFFYAGSTATDGVRGLFAGGRVQPVSFQNTIDYVTIASTGDATDFGDLTYSADSVAGCSNGYRAVFSGGDDGSPTFNTDKIDYITIGTLGNATSFGTRTHSMRNSTGFSNGFRGVFGGGYGNSPNAAKDIIDYISISTTSNATDFGNLTVAVWGLGGTSGD